MSRGLTPEPRSESKLESLFEFRIEEARVMEKCSLCAYKLFLPLLS